MKYLLANNIKWLQKYQKGVHQLKLVLVPKESEDSQKNKQPIKNQKTTKNLIEVRVDN